MSQVYNRHNLRWDTPTENYADRDRHGSVKLERNGRAKLSRADVIAIRTEYIPYSLDRGQPALARKYGITQTTVSSIVRGELWPGIH